ncbi:MAG: hypothetical protein ACRBFS_22670 [Aureispira sp.]
MALLFTESYNSKLIQTSRQTDIVLELALAATVQDTRQYFDNDKGAFGPAYEDA